MAPNAGYEYSFCQRITDLWAKFPAKEILLPCFYRDDEPPKGFCWDFCQQISWHKSQGVSVTNVTITHLNG